MKGAPKENVFSSTTERDFRQESYFNWCFGLIEPGCYAAVNLSNGKTTIFVPESSEGRRINVEETFDPAKYISFYGVDDCKYTTEIGMYLTQTSPAIVFILSGKEALSGLPVLEPEAHLLTEYEVNGSLLLPVLTEARVIKTTEEVDLIRHVCEITARAHIEVMRRVRPGWFEYQAESLFRHLIYTFGGCRNTAYVSRNPSGAIGYVQEYGSGLSPNGRKIEAGDLCVFDMGAEYYCYGSKATCTFPVTGKFTERQAGIYNAVRRISKTILAEMKPGIMWLDLHLLAENMILEELIRLKIVHGDIQEMTDCRLAAVFMPHGLGHFVGLDACDVGGYSPDTPERRPERGLNKLHTTRMLRGGMVITLRPAIYFNVKALHEAFRNPHLSRFMNEPEISKYYTFGGVRLEDTVLIKNRTAEVLTKVPRDLKLVEINMAEGQREDHAGSLLPTPKQERRFEEELKEL